jgi:nucleoid-associated protein YgaU
VTEAAPVVSERPGLGNTLAPVLATKDRATNAVPRNFDIGPISSAPIGEFTSSGARLRNEAPRPVGIDPCSPAVIRRLPTENNDVIDPYKVTDTKPAGPTWSAPPLLNTGYTETVPSPPPALPASYTPPASSVTDNQFANQTAPPPWPVREETAESRTHIVVDGDSLERLAGRYLSDPQRSREIYELNRELLSAPDLLPIGAELKIPERLASVAVDRHGFQPNSSDTRPSSSAGRADITPIQPASGQGIIPRAQLAPPVMVQ